MKQELKKSAQKKSLLYDFDFEHEEPSLENHRYQWELNLLSCAVKGSFSTCRDSRSTLSLGSSQELPSLSIQNETH